MSTTAASAGQPFAPAGTAGLRRARRRGVGSLLLLGAAALVGCRGGERAGNIRELATIDGLSVFEFDGLNLRARRAPDARDRILVVNGRGVVEVNLHPGDGFVLTNGRDRHEAYQVLAVSAERVVLKRETLLAHRDPGAGLRSFAQVVAVRPYNLEADEQRRTLAAGGSPPREENSGPQP